jgi:hypothetical protein
MVGVSGEFGLEDLGGGSAGAEAGGDGPPRNPPTPGWPRRTGRHGRHARRPCDHPDTRRWPTSTGHAPWADPTPGRWPTRRRQPTRPTEAPGLVCPLHWQPRRSPAVARGVPSMFGVNARTTRTASFVRSPAGELKRPFSRPRATHPGGEHGDGSASVFRDCKCSGVFAWLGVCTVVFAVPSVVVAQGAVLTVRLTRVV